MGTMMTSCIFFPGLPLPSGLHAPPRPEGPARRLLPPRAFRREARLPRQRPRGQERTPQGPGEPGVNNIKTHRNISVDHETFHKSRKPTASPDNHPCPTDVL